MTNTTRAIALGCLAGALTLLTGCADDSGKTVAGRTRSISNVQSGTSLASEAQLTLSQHRDQVTHLETFHLKTALVGTGAEEALLRLPNGEEHELAPDPSGFLALELDVDDPTTLAGAYSFLWFDALGSRRSLTLLATEDFPPFPTVTQPADRALVDPVDVEVRWSWDGSGGLFALAAQQTLPVADDGYRAEPLAELTHTIPLLEPGARYRIQLEVGDAPPGHAVRWVSATCLDVDTLQ